jgi:hypothetical protein
VNGNDAKEDTNGVLSYFTMPSYPYGNIPEHNEEYHLRFHCYYSSNKNNNHHHRDRVIGVVRHLETTTKSKSATTTTTTTEAA